MLLDGLAPRTDGVLLDAGGDGLREMEAFLAGRNYLTALDLVAPGQSGAVSLGTTPLDEATLAGAKPELGVLAAAMGGEGEPGSAGWCHLPLRFHPLWKRGRPPLGLHLVTARAERRMGWRRFLRRAWVSAEHRTASLCKE